MSDDNKAKVIDRITKLLALATSANENEAAVAMERAQALLAEHNLSADDVRLKGGGVEEKRYETKAPRTDSRPWRRSLASMVAKMYFCGYWYAFHKELSQTRGCGYIRYDEHHFVGEKHNLVVAKMLFIYLNDTIERLARESSMRFPVRERTSYQTSFKHACATRLCIRIQKRIAAAKAGQMKAEDGKTNLPALVGLYDKAEGEFKAFSEQRGIVVSKDRSQINHAGGVEDGRAAGDKIGLDKQLGNGGGTHLLASR